MRVTAQQREAALWSGIGAGSAVRWGCTHTLIVLEGDWKASSASQILRGSFGGRADSISCMLHGCRQAPGSCELLPRSNPQYVADISLSPIIVSCCLPVRRRQQCVLGCC